MASSRWSLGCPKKEFPPKLEDAGQAARKAAKIGPRPCPKKGSHPCQMATEVEVT